jgi:hypothetical protein
MPSLAIPDDSNHFQADHIHLLRRSFRHWTRRDLVNPRLSNADAARYIYTAPFVLVSHGTQPDPIFNYANRTALSLFGMSWEEITTCPSRLSAEAPLREEREQLLKEVAEQGYSEGYRGIRIGKHGRRFEIEQALVWNLCDERGIYRGQAASFRHWRWL